MNSIFKINSETVIRPYIIAEIGVNHEGSIDNAKRMIALAKEGGANAVKFQTYKASTIASKESPSYWDLNFEPTKTQYELFKKHDKFWKKEMEELKRYSQEFEIDFMSTPFDFESANFLNDLMNIFKISSSDITNKPFIDYITNFKKPIILSTGASDLNEIKDAYKWIKNKGNDLALLHCVLNYPTLDENANLGMIRGLKDNFPDCVVGYSDHTMPNQMSICEMATCLGSRIIEKHFTLDKSLPGNDHYHSMDVSDLKVLVEKINNLIKVIGTSEVRFLESEKKSRINARRSIVLLKDLNAGDTITKENITFKRPGTGVSPNQIDKVLGMKLLKNKKADSLLNWTDLDLNE
jgi:N-acetylneuraminate synthase